MIKTTPGSDTGTHSDFTIRFFGEKGQGDTFSLHDVIHKKEVKNGEKLSFFVESDEDAGCINKIELTRDKQLLLRDGWEIDYIKISKYPIAEGKDVSVFRINSRIERAEKKSFKVTSGYRFSILQYEKRIEIESEGMLYVPPAVSYSRTFTTTLNIAVNRSSLKTTDRSSGKSINISYNAISAALDEHINQSIANTLEMSVNVTVDCSETLNVDGTDEPITYEILWNKEIYRMSVEMGETIFTFDIPVKKYWYGLEKRMSSKKTPVFDAIGIALTRKCTAQCEMCCFECDPDKEEELDKELIFRIIDEAAEIKEIEKIGFTGGEATLREDVLIEAINRTKQRGMSASLTSNGFWGREPDHAKRWMENLYAAGLDSLTISIDEYHQKYVPLESVRNIIQANKKNPIRLSLAVGDSLGNKDAISIIHELGKDAYEIPLILYPFMPVGRGEKLEKVMLQEVDSNWACHNQRMLSILYDGSVYPCCSQAVYGSFLCEGNIKDTSLKDIVDKYQYFSMFSELTRHNFGWIISKAEEYQVPVSKEVHSACTLCHEIFTNKEFVEKFKDDVIREKVASILQKIDDNGTIGLTNKRITVQFTCTLLKVKIEKEIKCQLPGGVRLISMSATDHVGNHYKAIFTCGAEVQADKHTAERWITAALSDVPNSHFRLD